MKKVLKLVGGLLLAVVLVLGGFALYVSASGVPHYPTAKIDLKVDVTPERVARGRRTASMLCGYCHLDPASGALSGKHMADMDPALGVVWSGNLTHDPDNGIGRWTDGEIAYLLRTGVSRDGRYTPPWMVKMPLLSDEDLKDLIAFLRSDDPLVRAVPAVPAARPSFLLKLLEHTVMRPLPYSAKAVADPDPNDKLAVGRYLVQGRLLCFSCHSKDFSVVNDLEPEKSGGYFGGGNPMLDLAGRTVPSANLTPDPETGIGKWSEDDFRRALKYGIRPDRTPLVYPMLPYPALTDEEVGAIFAYLKTIPTIRNPRQRPPATVLAQGAPKGKVAYYVYACNSCHGDTGQGLYDLRPGVKRYATDAELIAWIRHPELARPGIRMPTWDGVIAEEDYAPLAAYVRSLAGS